MSSTEIVLEENRRAVEATALSSLLRTELSACETYRTAIHDVERGGEGPALALRCLYGNHRRLADEARGLIRNLGGPPTESAGAWGVWSAVHERIAEMKGRASDATLLRALRHGERYSLELARDALHDLEGSEATWARRRLIGKLVANLDLLEALEESAIEARESSPSA
jgi:hypothetical protein